MSESGYLDKLKQYLSFLFTKYEYKITFHEDSMNFGNKYTLLESDDLIIAVTRDRDLISLDVRNNDGEEVPRDKHYRYFFDLLIILRSLGAPEEKKIELMTDTTDEGQLSALSAALETYYKQIHDMFSPEKVETTKKELRRLEMSQVEEIFGLDDNDS